MKKKLFIDKILKKDNFFSVVTFKLIILYRKIKYFKYKYFFMVDEKIILFNVKGEFSGKIREIYETMINDEKYMGFLFMVSLNDPSKCELENSTTRKMFNRSKRYYKFLSKAKYYFTDEINLHLTRKKEQVFNYLYSDEEEIINNKLDKYKLKKENKYLNKYIDFKIDVNKISNLKKLCEDIILSKQDVSLTLTYSLYKKIVVVPFRDFKVKVKGFFREHFFCLSKNAKKIKKYKNKYKGKRCILVGNGPSLTVSDLDMIKDEITFGCNLITKIYDKTEWRPTYHCFADALYAKFNGEELMSELCSDVFTLSNAYEHLKKYDYDHELISIDYISNQLTRKYKVKMPIAYTYPGASVMTVMLCLALYMGFKEIYLLGVDATSSLSNNGHFIKGYMDESVKRRDMKRVSIMLKKDFVTEEEVAKYYHDRVINAYSVIRDYAEKKGVKIYNCTRGGALEVYERKKLEDVLKEEK